MLKIFECLRCGEKWASRQDKPLCCGKCKSSYWDTPRRKAKDEAGAKEKRLRYLQKRVETIGADLRLAGTGLTLEAAEVIEFLRQELEAMKGNWAVEARGIMVEPIRAEAGEVL